MGISSYHPGGVNVAVGDGSVQFVSNNVNSDILRALLMRAGEMNTLVFLSTGATLRASVAAPYKPTHHVCD
jgi:prepilin-type processing-associated H-X9-DG protein